ncbi:MAG: hypothetical protein COT00_00475, partial [Candidatus Omnitrophica bacterium CG07_land_8_20_14_0_80_50_8]
MLVDYQYDPVTGDLLSVTNVGQRRTMQDEVLQAKDKVSEDKYYALEDVALAANLSIQAFKTSIDAARAQLQAERQQTENELHNLENQDVDCGFLDFSCGDKKRAKSRGLDQIRDAIRQIDQAIVSFNEDAAAKLVEFDTQMTAQLAAKKAAIEADGQKAFSELDAQAGTFDQEMKRQESEPVVSNYYRSILGRDATKTELQSFYAEVASNGVVNVAALKAKLSDASAGSEFSARTTRMHRIRGEIESSLDAYLASDSQGRAAVLTSLGIDPSQAVSLTLSDIQKIKQFLDNQDLHFGESAIDSLMNLLAAKGIMPNRDDVATKLVLVDIFTGVINPFTNENSQLLVSLYSLQKVAALYGVSPSSLRLTYDDLLSIFTQAPSTRVLVHVGDVHYSVVTSVTQDQVTLLESNGDLVTIKKADFEKTWDGASLSTDAQLIPQSQAKIIPASEAQKITGGCFFLIPMIIGAISSIMGAIAGILAAIGGLIAQIGALIGNILVGFGQAIGGFMQAVGGFVHSIYLGVKFVAVSLFHGLTGLFASTLPQAIAGAGAKVTLGQAIFNTAIKIGTSYIVNKGLTALGVDPVYASILSSFVTGGIHGGFTSQGLDLGFSLADGLKGGLQIGAQ